MAPAGYRRIGVCRHRRAPAPSGGDTERVRNGMVLVAMPLKLKRSPAEGEFLFEIDEEPTEECWTALGGAPLFVRTARSLDVPGSVKRNLTVKQRDRGFDEATYIKSFLVLNAVGGDCLEDFDCLREDRGLAAMLGHAAPSPEAARKFLYQFHDPQKMEQAQRELPIGEVSYVPEESAALRGLAQVNQDVTREFAAALRRGAHRNHRYGVSVRPTHLSKRPHW